MPEDQRFIVSRPVLGVCLMMVGIVLSRLVSGLDVWFWLVGGGVALLGWLVCRVELWSNVVDGQLHIRRRSS